MNSKENFEKLLNHKCDITHCVTGDSNVGYGLKSKNTTYPEKSDLTDIRCHFHSESLNVNQGEPHQDLVSRRKVDFPIDTDVRLNDKVVFDGLTYYAEVPNNVRDHHITVYVQRKGKDAYG